MTNRHYLCTRPRLAAMLISAGVPTTKTNNPFAEDGQHRKAWYADLNPKSAKIIADYFTSIGKPAPASVAEYLNGGAANG